MDIEELLSLLDCNTIFIKSNPQLHTTFNGATLLFHPLRMALADKDAVIFCRASYFNELPASLTEERAFFSMSTSRSSHSRGNRFSRL